MLLANGQLAEQGLAELTPQISSSYYYPESQGLQLEREYALYGAIYRAQPWVRSIIDKRAAAMAKLPVRCMFSAAETEIVETDTGYAKLLKDPCSYLDPFSFWTWVWTTIDIYGETYLAIVRDDKGLPEKLLPLHPSRIAIKRDPRTSEYTYYFQAGSGLNTELVHFPQKDIVPFRLFNPNGVERGLSRMESLKSTIFSEDSSRNATASMWRNAGRPNLVISHDKHLSEPAQKRLQQQFDQAHAGSSKAGKTLVIEEGMTVTPLQLTAVEMQFIESRQLNREEVCGVYDVAPPIIHILDRATFSNISAQMRAFYRDTMSVPIAFVQSVMDKWVGDYWRRNNRMKFDIDEVIQPDWEAKSESTQKMVNSGVATPNEGREIMGLSRSDDPKADQLYANSALQPLGAPPEQIRMEGQIDGTTPDGINTIAAPVPVATLDQSKPTPVPKLPPGRPRPSMTKPAANTPAPKHLRAVKGAFGRQPDIDGLALALQLIRKYPDDIEDILTAVLIAESTTE